MDRGRHSRKKRMVALDAPLPGGGSVGDLVAAPWGAEDEDALPTVGDSAAAMALLNQLVHLPLLTRQQSEILGAFVSMTLTAGCLPSQRAVAVFLGMEPSAGRKLVKVQWHQLIKRLRAARAAGDIPALDDLFPAA